jgi:hypothetical protein
LFGVDGSNSSPLLSSRNLLGTRLDLRELRVEFFVFAADSLAATAAMLNLRELLGVSVTRDDLSGVPATLSGVFSAADFRELFGVFSAADFRELFGVFSAADFRELFGVSRSLAGVLRLEFRSGVRLFVDLGLEPSASL